MNGRAIIICIQANTAKYWNAWKQLGCTSNPCTWMQCHRNISVTHSLPWIDQVQIGPWQESWIIACDDIQFFLAAFNNTDTNLVSVNQILSPSFIVSIKTLLSIWERIGHDQVCSPDRSHLGPPGLQSGVLSPKTHTLSGWNGVFELSSTY